MMIGLEGKQQSVKARGAKRSKTALKGRREGGRGRVGTKHEGAPMAVSGEWGLTAG